MSCAGNGYLSGNMLIPFPFEDGQSIPCGGREAELLQCLQKCFVDAGISISGSPDDGNWPTFGDFSVSGEVLSFKIRIGGSDTQISVSGSSSSRFPIVSGSAEWGSYVVVLSSEGILEFCGMSPPDSMQSEDSFLRLCAKCVTYAPDVLSSVMVFDGVHEFSDGPHFTLSGDVSLKPGNNMRLAEVDDDPNSIELNAEPGAGLGVVPCTCEDDGGNPQLAGPDGHGRVFNDTCYDLEPNTTTGVLKMHVKCTACCTCKMYEEIVNDRLVMLADAVRKAKGDINSMLASYESAVKQFNYRISRPELADISLTLTGMPIGSRLSPKIDNEKVKGRMDRCVFTATVSNSSYFTVSAAVRSIVSSGFIAEASAAWSGADGSPLSKTGDSSGAVSGSYSIYPGRSLVLTFVAVRGDMVNRVVTGGHTGSITVNLSWNGTQLGVLSKSVSV